LGLEGELQLKRVTFLRHPDGKIVLGYTGIVDENATITIDPVEVSAYYWADMKAIESKRIDIGIYIEIVLRTD